MPMSAPPDASGSATPSTDFLRLGLIGAGRWGRNYISTIKELDDAVLACVSSRNPATAALVPAGCQIYTDWSEMIADGDLAGVIIATPPAHHAAAVEACLRAGLGVMVEKPLTMSVADAERLGQTADETRLPVLVDHTQLFHPGYERLKELAKSSGRIRDVRSSGGNWGPFRPDTPVLWDYGPHDVAFCLDLLGELPSSVDVLQDERKHLDMGVGESLNFALGFPGGAGAGIHISNMMAVKTRRLEVQFDDQILVLDDQAHCKLQRIIKDTAEAIPYADARPLTQAVKAFVRGIRGKAVPTLGLKLGIEVVRVLTRLAGLRRIAAHHGNSTRQ